MAMRNSFSITTRAAVAALVLALAACGGGGDGGGTPPAPPANTPLGQAIAAAAAIAANDTSANASSAFKVLQDNGVPAVIVASAPKVNFTVFSDGKVKSDLQLSNMSFAVAKLVPGANGEIDQWVSYVNRIETAAAGVGPGGNQTPRATALQATTDPKPAGQANQLVFNNDGYYTYTFSTDITDPAKTMGVTFEPNRTHRIAIQLSYVNAAGETVRVNPYFDVTFDASGRSVAVTDPNATRVMADVGSCNGCHEKLALHGGGRVDVQYCVMCHNPGTTDANSGNVLTMATMTHKIHAGRLLKSKLDSGEGGEEYVIWGFQNSRHDYAEVGFPQDLRNCSVCHSAANPKTPQGDNWKSRASKEACLTCHANGAASRFVTTHTGFALAIVGAGATPKDIPNASCAECHRAGAAVSPERVHFNQNEENAAKYRMNIEAATYDSATRAVTIKYSLTDPTNNNDAYNLVTADCTAGPTCGNTTRFGNLRFYIAYQNLPGQSTRVTEFTAFNNGGSGANAFAYRGVNDGSNRYTIDIMLPADTATAVAAGTARVVSIGQVKEPKLEAKSAADPRPEVSPRTLVNVVVQHAYKDFVISGAASPRRQVVSNEKCNVCHGALGTTSGSNTKAEAFHSGARNTVESCALCHDALRSSSSTKMTSGVDLQESFQFKRMIHGIHGNSKRIYPFTHGNAVVGAFCNPRNALSIAPLCDPSLTLAADVTNYAAEVAYPAVGLSCNACHVDDSYKRDLSPVPSVVSLRNADPRLNLVISPQAAACTACHDSKKAIDHVTQAGASSFGSRTLSQDALVQETCVDCHALGSFKAVDVVHGLK
jgi:OmcA/MtrC family decaheme c-type cytochrome